ncbi:MAG: PAS domain S-box protein [Gemmatimonadaceae bacterium]|nr:PAS domain S-box protein [Gemmatimonadaceae bacterium]
MLRGVLDAGFDSFAIARAVRSSTGEITDFVIVELNARASAMVGQPREQLIGRSLLDIFPNSRAWRLWEQLCAAILTQRAFETTQHAPSPEEPDRWLQRQLVPLPGEAVAISSRDVTQRHRAQLALEASEARFRQLFENPSAVQLLVDRTTARIVEANTAAESFYGWSRTTLCTMSLTDIESVGLEHWRELTALPESGGLRLVREHRVSNGARRAVELRVGRVNSDGQSLLHCIVHDQSALQQASQQRDDAEARFRTLIAGMREGIVLHDGDGVIRMHNPAAERILGLTGAQLTGLQPVDHDWQAMDEAGEPWPTTQHPGLEALRTGHSQPRQFMRVTRGGPGGRTTWLAVSADALVRLGETRPYASIAVFSDVTDMRHAEERLRETQALETVAQVAGGIGHDLNNLLTVIRAASTFLRDGFSETSPHLDDVAAIERATDRAESLTRRLLAAGRRPNPLSEVVDVLPLVHQWRDGLVEEWPAGIQLVIDATSSPTYAAIDPLRVREVVEALVRQARSALPARGVITVRVSIEQIAPPATHLLARPAHVRQPRAMATLSVHDTAPPVEKNLGERLGAPTFDPEGGERARELELAVAHTLLRQTGGFLSVQSDADGNTVRAHWPITIMDSAPTTPVVSTPLSQSADTAPQHPVRRGSILLVDDDARLRDLGRRMLERAGEAVYTAATGQEALDFLRVRADDVGLVVTDLTMPDMGGLELIEQMAEEFPAIPAVAVSGYSVNPHAQGLLEARHVPYVQKPFTGESLTSAIARARAIWPVH